jgi:hypothetical protein
LTIEINGQPFDLMMLVRAVRDIEDPYEGIMEATQLIDQTRDVLLIELAAVRRSFTVQAQTALRAEGMNVSTANREIARRAQTSEASVKRMMTEAGQYGVSTK